MCFSATASFTAAAGLSTIGVITLREAKTRSQLPLAVMPLLFGIRQLHRRRRTLDDRRHYAARG
ncbi:hypothetical protein A3C96_03880 [Candidatus Uhrbacteria bacterium RIFCSPHIGHO2_02_FULL_60_10]|uniref:Uncharacterized protein n=1 Tax=Candidatus Uhrbacteria bacterium RIFCSPHIGHO2_02_FULL_60_10 TaxID=1802392 RepID=A0A1F7U8Y1_9BACT|nr:MAG: hypothetical protein A3C96_03880 [Candidatus Uhrbacteria bacterium RIFCSPHIGHO2_02_FULL_60_10]